MHINAKSSAMKPIQFLTIHRDMVALLLPMDKVDRVLEETGRWSVVRDELVAICDTVLGKRLFGDTLAKVLASTVEDIAQDHVSKFLTGKKVLLASVQTLKKNLLDKIMAVPHVAELPDRRKIRVSYRGIHTSMKVNSIAEEISLRVDAELKTVAVVSGLLPPLFCEHELAITRKLTAEAAKSKPAFEEILLRPWADARELANSLLASAACSDGWSIKVMLQWGKASLSECMVVAHCI